MNICTPEIGSINGRWYYLASGINKTCNIMKHMIRKIQYLDTNKYYMDKNGSKIVIHKILIQITRYKILHKL